MLRVVGFLTLAAVVMWVAALVRSPDLPDTAPEFTLANLEGEAVSLSDFRGQTVVLNFWATWCMPCRIEAPALSRFARSHPDVPVLGIAADGTVAELRDAVDDLGIDYLVLRGDREVLAAYDVGTYPTTVVVRPDGTIRRAYSGMLLDPHFWFIAR